MSVNNKTYIDNNTGESITIKDSYGDIAVTESNTKISVQRLTNTLFYTEEIDPKNFFNSDSTLNAFADKIKNIDTTQLPTDGPEPVQIQADSAYQPSMNDSAVIYGEVDPEDERAALLAKYNHPPEPKKTGSGFDSLLEGDTQPQNNNLVRPNPEYTQPKQEPVQHNPNVYQEPNRPVAAPDPMVSMFKNIKRNNKFEVSLTLTDKIPRTDFIEMMEDSYEKSIIDFLADEFTNKILRDPQSIKDMIIKELENKVYPNGKPVDEEEMVEVDVVVPIKESIQIPTEEFLEKEVEKLNDIEDLIYGPTDPELSERIEKLTKDMSIDDILGGDFPDKEEVEEPIAIEIIDEVENLIEEVKEKETAEVEIDTEEKEIEEDDKSTLSDESS
jgi:hypothetical protein